MDIAAFARPGQVSGRQTNDPGFESASGSAGGRSNHRARQPSRGGTVLLKWDAEHLYVMGAYYLTHDGDTATSYDK